VSTADLAIIGMAVVALASVCRDYKLQMRVADRLRLVNPPKVPAEDKPETAANTVDIAARRTGT
jgi:hypothetical protein